jgi:hypothetical protein
LEEVVVGADHPWHDHPGGAEAVGVAGKGVSTKEFQEPVYLALGMMKTPRTGPPVGAAIDRLVAMGVDDATQLVGQQFGEFVP